MAKRPPRKTYGTQAERHADMPEKYKALGHKVGRAAGGGKSRRRKPGTSGAQIIVNTANGERRVPRRRVVGIPSRTTSPLDRRVARMEEMLAKHGVKPGEISLRNHLSAKKPHNAEFLAAWEERHGRATKEHGARRIVPELRNQLEAIIEDEGGEGNRVRRVASFLRRHGMRSDALRDVLDLRRESHASFLDVWNATRK